MIRTLVTCFAVLVAHTAVAQTVTVEVWKLTRPDTPPQPATDAAVRIATADSQPSGPPQPPQIPTGQGPQGNQYVLDGSLKGPLIDVTARVEDYHMWVARDLLVEPASQQNVIVQLFHFDYPIRAPQCFALKTQYELLFRMEQRLSPQLNRKEIQHRARLKYADGILALPSLSRQHFQSPETRQMLAEMTEEARRELSDMGQGLSKLYDMDGFERYTPSQWQTQYNALNGELVNSEVRLFGTHGTYTTSDGAKHVLEGIDIFTEEDANGGGNDVITGHWRYAPGTPQEVKGTFRWQGDGSDNHFEGYFQRPGDANKYSWKGDRIQQPNGEHLLYRPLNGEHLLHRRLNAGQPAPPINGAAPAPRGPRPIRRIPAPAPALPAPAPPAP